MFVLSVQFLYHEIIISELSGVKTSILLLFNIIIDVIQIPFRFPAHVGEIKAKVQFYWLQVLQLKFWLQWEAEKTRSETE